MKKIAILILIVVASVAIADLTPQSSEATTAAKTITALTVGTITTTAIPTATTGLTSGQVWANSNVLTIVP